MWCLADIAAASATATYAWLWTTRDGPPCLQQLETRLEMCLLLADGWLWFTTHGSFCPPQVASVWIYNMCNTLQHTATHCNTLMPSTSSECVDIQHVMHCVAVCCIVLQCVAVCCSMATNSECVDIQHVMPCVNTQRVTPSWHWWGNRKRCWWVTPNRNGWTALERWGAGVEYHFQEI